MNGAEKANHDRDVQSLEFHLKVIERLLEKILAALAPKEADDES